MLLLLPTESNKLQLKWQWPFVVIEKVRENNYKVHMGELAPPPALVGLRKFYCLSTEFQV